MNDVNQGKEQVVRWLLVLLLSFQPLSSGAESFAEMRKEMLEKIRYDTILTSRTTGKRTLNVKVMRAMGKVPRHEFISEVFSASSYVNQALPIGYGQTISQPFIVALMTDFLELKAHHVVLEVGTGSGYQAAVLAELANQVYSIEIIPELGKSAATRLKTLGYGNVEVKIGDGYQGWKAHAPFDAIIVTAASPDIPPALINQLKPGGRMMIPIGGEQEIQQLTLLQKNMDKTVIVSSVLPVSFVPLTGDH